MLLLPTLFPYLKMQHNLNHRLGTLIRHLKGLAELLDGISLGYKAIQLHPAVGKSLHDDLEIVVAIHIVCRKGQLMLLMHPIGKPMPSTISACCCMTPPRFVISAAC